MRKYEVNITQEDTFISKLEDLRRELDGINEALKEMGYPVIELQISQLQDVRDYVAKELGEEVSTTAVYFDIENKKKVV